ncbi:general secretion pathway protein N [Pseudidiomarina planktonica]|uniref:Type II secretion system protein N n=1 Tax=Pseudidiomarina planktonica TaxID=1323738 RepID=A0A1Y6EN96_9GAMM|nr:type II secretion system protein N [Pseudidiomarina planktonica]RUO65942.1 type II secretion system protein N [Pseudidiomarina planktonica]SMQ61643.1 general secretion pathway protein N [Pseudidiomarina planktonica]
MMQGASKKLGFATILVLFFLIALLVTAPARLLHLAPLPKGIAVYDVTGSLWQGQAGQISVELPNTPKALRLHNVSWDLSFWSLLTGQLHTSLELPELNNVVSGELILTAGRGGVTISDADLGGRIADSISTFNIPAPLTVDGRWQAQIDRFQPEGGTNLCKTLQAQVRGQQVALKINQNWQDLGNYQLNLGCNQGAVTVLMNGDNMMGLMLDSAINRSQSTIAGSLQPKPEAPEKVTELLVYVGKPDAQGRYNFAFKL